jgi:hypothetical protein
MTALQTEQTGRCQTQRCGGQTLLATSVCGVLLLLLVTNAGCDVPMWALAVN